MCQLTDAARKILGIRPYAWKQRAPRFNTVRTGARGTEINGTGVTGASYGLTPDERRRLEHLERECRAIRKMLDSMGQG